MRPRAPATPRPPLTRERIERAALALIEREGLAAFSTRKLGQRLGCEAMSIYHHFPSKAHLLDALVDRVVGEIPIPASTVEPLERARAIVRGFRAAGHKYPHFFQYLVVHRMNSAVGLNFINAAVQSLRDSGLNREQAARLFRVLGYYIMGATLDETAGYAKGPSSLNPVSGKELKERFPAIAEAGEYFSPEQHEKTFALGLDLILAGIEQAGRQAVARAKRKRARA